MSNSTQHSVDWEVGGWNNNPTQKPFSGKSCDLCDRERGGERERERERERNVSGLPIMQTFRQQREGEETFRVIRVSFHLPTVLLADGRWRKGDPRGRPERPPPRSSRQSASALSLAGCVPSQNSTRVCSRAVNLFGSALDAVRCWRGAVRVRVVSPGAGGKSGCGCPLERWGGGEQKYI